MSTADCRHLAVERTVGHSIVTWLCKGCGRRWQARIVGGYAPMAPPS